MAFVGMPALTAAVSNAGGLGMIGAAPLPPPLIIELIQQTRELTRKPFGVNLIVADGFPGSAVPFTTDAHVEVCAYKRVPVVSFHWDLPRRRWVDQLHAAGSQVWMQVGSVGDAVSAVERGVDAVIVQGSNAGGHGKAHVPLRTLLPAVKRAVSVPLLAAGGIATAADVSDALAAGAQAAWVGTRFVASTEAFAHEEYKRRIVASNGYNSVKTTMFGPEWQASMRVLRNRVVNEWAGREDQIPTPPPPPAVIGRTMFAGTPYVMPKFSAMLPTPDTSGRWEEMAFAAGGDAARSVHAVLPAGAIVRSLTPR